MSGGVLVGILGMLAAALAVIDGRIGGFELGAIGLTFCLGTYLALRGAR